MNRITLLLRMVLALVVLNGFALGQRPAAPQTHLKAGDPAPDFTLVDHNGQRVTLSSFKGKKNVVLAFYVLAFTGG